VTQTFLSSGLDLDRLLRLRLTVARHSEMDAARWWNSKGMLGRYGAVVLKRGFPSTHYFAQARVVFAVARHRCAELFDPPGCMTLWHLPPKLEDQFEERWQTWLDEAERWTPFFENLAGLQGDDLLDALKRRSLRASRAASLAIQPSLTHDWRHRRSHGEILDPAHQERRVD